MNSNDIGCAALNHIAATLATAVNNPIGVKVLPLYNESDMSVKGHTLVFTSTNGKKVPILSYQLTESLPPDVKQMFPGYLTFLATNDSYLLKSEDEIMEFWSKMVDDIGLNIVTSLYPNNAKQTLAIIDRLTTAFKIPDNVPGTSIRDKSSYEVLKPDSENLTPTMDETPMPPTTKNNILPAPAVAKQIMVSALHDYITTRLMPEISDMLPGIMPVLEYDVYLLLPMNKETKYDIGIRVNWAVDSTRQDFIGVDVGLGENGELSVIITVVDNLATEFKQHTGVVDDIMQELIPYFSTGMGATQIKRSLHSYLSYYLSIDAQDPNRSVYARVCGEHMAKLLTTKTTASEKSVYETYGREKEYYTVTVVGASQGIAPYEFVLKLPVGAFYSHTEARLKDLIAADPITRDGWQKGVPPVTMTWTENTHHPENVAGEKAELTTAFYKATEIESSGFDNIMHKFIDGVLFGYPDVVLEQVDRTYDWGDDNGDVVVVTFVFDGVGSYQVTIPREDVIQRRVYARVCLLTAMVDGLDLDSIPITNIPVTQFVVHTVTTPNLYHGGAVPLPSLKSMLVQDN